MKMRMLALILALSCLLCALTGCATVLEVTGEVVNAAKEELENQIREKLGEYKVTPMEFKSAFGKLNDDGGKYQCFYAVLVQTDTESHVINCAQTLGKAFSDSGYMLQTASAVESKYLVHKTVTYDHADFTAGNYYTIFVYVDDLLKVVPTPKETAAPIETTAPAETE